MLPAAPCSQNEPFITIAIATYGRPDALRCAVQSVLRQTRSDWSLIVVGDACGEDTAAAMAPFLADPRIRYVNLTTRCGEQALPNSAVMAVASTRFIALLNHDDLWLPDHLQRACGQLEQSGADFFLGRSAWAWGKPSDEPGIPLLDTLSPEPRDPLRFFDSGMHYVEPASAWVFTRALAERVGPWRRASDLFRTPIEDWALRAWRAGARMIGAREVSCLKFENQWAEAAPQRKYDTPAAPQIAMTALIENPHRLALLRQHLAALEADPKAVGRGMRLQLAASQDPQKQAIGRFLLSADMARIYLQTGLDAYSWFCAETGLQRGWRWRWALKQRTGEDPVDPPSFASVVDQVAGALR